MANFEITDADDDILVLERGETADWAKIFGTPIIQTEPSRAFVCVTIKPHHWQLLYDWIATNCPVERHTQPVEGSKK